MSYGRNLDHYQETGTRVTRGRPVRTFDIGRECVVCGATVSKYNPNDTCWKLSLDPPVGLVVGGGLMR